MWQLTGQKPEDKLDPGSRDSTIKRLAAFYSPPTVIEDNASSNKVIYIKNITRFYIYFISQPY